MSRGCQMDKASRDRLAQTLVRASTIRHVAEQIALFGAPRFRSAYVERRGDGYRWSIAHRGGPYPLLRELALLVDVPHTALVMAFTTLEGWAIVRAPDLDGEPDSWAMIEPSDDLDINVQRILEATGGS